MQPFKLIAWIPCIALAVFNTVSYAQPTDLWSVYQDAVKNDPVFEAQKAILEESMQDVPIARADLLPELLLNAKYAHSYQNSRITGYNDFDSSQYSLNLSQPIFNAAAFLQLKSAHASVQAAVVRFSAQEQALMSRVVRAYLAVLEARDLFVYTQSQERFSQEFLTMSRKRYKERFATVTELDQAKQQLQSLRAQVISAKIDYDQQIENLSDITAVTYHHFPYFKKSTPLVTPFPNKMTTWISEARRNNLLLRAAQFDIIAAKHRLGGNKANFLPNLSVFGSYSDINQLSTQNNQGLQNNVTASEVGLRASWPLIQGGLTIAEVKQAKAAYDKATADANKVYLDTLLNTRNAFRSIRDGLQRVRAAKYAVNSGLNGLLHTEAGFKAGVQTIFDLLQAQNRLFDSEKSYLNYFYNYLLNTILLKEANGSLSPNDIDRLNHYLSKNIRQSMTIISAKRNHAP